MRFDWEGMGWDEGDSNSDRLIAVWPVCLLSVPPSPSPTPLFLFFSILFIFLS